MVRRSTRERGQRSAQLSLLPRDRGRRWPTGRMRGLDARDILNTNTHPARRSGFFDDFPLPRSLPDDTAFVP